ncbi:MAG: 4a-hydroxytetrahydrobiopterin dehydratase [Bradymonadia bacterium]|jgi:4a-hydroxytetrahydrobiopterin dehydratase
MKPSRAQRYTPDEALAVLDPAWSVHDGALRRVFEFEDFAAAFAFMARSACLAERLDHHPDWSNGGGRVTVDLKTHDVGGLTGLDVALARAMDRYAA